MASVDRHEVISFIRAHLAGRDVEPSDVVEEASFVDDLYIDSLDLMTLAQELGDRYGRPLPPEEAVRIETVGQAIDFVLGIDREPVGARSSDGGFAG